MIMEDNTPMKLDFSPVALRRQVRRETLQKPYVLYPAAVAIVGGFSVLILGASLLAVGALLLGSVAVGAALVVDLLLRREVLTARHLHRLRHILAERVGDSIHNLRRNLEEVQSLEGVQQLDRLENKYATFKELLQQRLNAHELTYTRYLGMTEQVYLAGLDNLNSIAGISKSMSALDLPYIQQRIQNLGRQAQLSVAETKELETLQKRLQLRESQQEKIQILFSQNEEAMTTINHLMAVLAEMNTGRSRARMDMEDSLKELEQLAERSSRYS
jgi:hypothetical protein